MSARCPFVWAPRCRILDCGFQVWLRAVCRVKAGLRFSIALSGGQVPCSRGPRSQLASHRWAVARLSALWESERHGAFYPSVWLDQFVTLSRFLYFVGTNETAGLFMLCKDVAQHLVLRVGYLFMFLAILY